MPDPSIEKPIIALGSWLQTPLGAHVLAWEQARLDALTADIFGFNAVQIGLPQLDALAASRMPNRWLSATHIPPVPIAADSDIAARVVLTHDASELPYATQSLDLVVLPHVLEFAREPHQVLREIERVLIPEGQVIICGFNPASLWGLRQTLARACGQHFLPPNTDFIHLPRLKDWLKLLNMEVNRGHFGCYAPPVQSAPWLGHFNFMEPAGDRWWPYFGAVYIVQAIKRVHGMRLVGPVWSLQTASVAHGVPAANSVHNADRHR
ncbi:MAG: class I SAM-dependent methyltransferase [Herbaspirillum sp.]